MNWQRLREEDNSMARFSIGGAHDGEGPSRSRSKRPRLRVRCIVGGEEVVFEPNDDLEDQQQQDQNQEQFETEGTSEELEDGDEARVRRPRLDNFSASGNKRDYCSDNGDPMGSSREGFLSVTFTDPDVLDCFICCEPLTVPVFQCDNGHIACSSCCVKLGNVCPSCQMPIGYSRCRAIEKVLESIKISCPNAEFGCNETFSYSWKSIHEKTCIYMPCQCPFTNCNFFGSYKQLSSHFGSTHASPVMRFKYGSVHTFILRKTDKFLILEEETEGSLFVLCHCIINNGSTNIGNIVVINSIGPSSLDGKFSYDLHVIGGESSVKLQSWTKRIIDKADKVENLSVNGCLLVPDEFFGSAGRLRVKLTILDNGDRGNE